MKYLGVPYIFYLLFSFTLRTHSLEPCSEELATSTCLVNRLVMGLQSKERFQLYRNECEACADSRNEYYSEVFRCNEFEGICEEQEPVCAIIMPPSGKTRQFLSVCQACTSSQVVYMKGICPGY
jgi:hypothetical protein